MNATNEPSTIAELQARVKAQQKTIDVLMNAVEQRSAEDETSLALLTQNLNLEKVVQRKTETLRQQGEELQQTLLDLQMTQTQLLQAKKLESVGQLAAGIAHEINTPVQFIGSNIEFIGTSFGDIKGLINAVIDLLDAIANGAAIEARVKTCTALLADIDWPYLDEEIPSAIKQSQEGIKRISTIVQAMKEFSHPSSREMVKNDLNKLIQTTIIVTSNEWKYFAEIRTDLDPALPEVFCLADELGQVFLNVLVNAAHAIEEKTKGEAEVKKGVISISTRQDLDMVEIRIADTGSGIGEDIKGRVFDPFFTTKVVGKGTGQGLAIAHNVITQKHDGTITFTSDPGHGTVFIIRLPLGDSSPRQPSSPAADAPATHPAPSHRG